MLIVEDPGGLFSVEAIKELSAYAALLGILGFMVWRAPKVVSDMLKAFREEIATERARCDKQNMDDRARADAQIARRDERFDRMLSLMENGRRTHE